MLSSQVTSIASQLQSDSTVCAAAALVQYENKDMKLLIACNRYAASPEKLFEEFNYYLHYLVVLCSIRWGIQNGVKHPFLQRGDNPKKKAELFRSVFSSLNPNWTNKQKKTAFAFLLTTVSGGKKEELTDLEMLLSNHTVLDIMGTMWAILKDPNGDDAKKAALHKTIEKQLAEKVLILPDESSKSIPLPSIAKAWAEIPQDGGGEALQKHLVRKGYVEYQIKRMHKPQIFNSLQTRTDYYGDMHAEMKIVQYLIDNDNVRTKMTKCGISKTPCFCCTATFGAVNRLLRHPITFLQSEYTLFPLHCFKHFPPLFVIKMMGDKNIGSSSVYQKGQRSFYQYFIEECFNLIQKHRLHEAESEWVFNWIENSRKIIRNLPNQMVNSKTSKKKESDHLLYLFRYGLPNLRRFTLLKDSSPFLLKNPSEGNEHAKRFPSPSLSA